MGPRTFVQNMEGTWYLINLEDLTRFRQLVDSENYDALDLEFSYCYAGDPAKYTLLEMYERAEDEEADE